MFLLGFMPYLSGSGVYSKELVRAFQRKLDRISLWFRRQRKYAYIASSLLFVYDATVFQQGGGSINSNTLFVDYDHMHDENHNEDHCAALFDKACDVRMIDFAHALQTDCIDSNYLGGLQCLLSIFDDILKSA